MDAVGEDFGLCYAQRAVWIRKKALYGIQYAKDRRRHDGGAHRRAEQLYSNVPAPAGHSVSCTQRVGLAVQLLENTFRSGIFAYREQTGDPVSPHGHRRVGR